jgi:DNA-binding HxlR family transcriptional regulator
MKKAPTSEELFAVLSDGITIKMLKLASTGFRARGGYPNKLKITKKQYTSRLHKLVAIGLIHKRNAVYVLTALGQIVEKTMLRLVEEAVDNWWKLKAIDSFEKGIPIEEKRKIIDSILSSTLIRETLLKHVE